MRTAAFTPYFTRREFLARGGLALAAVCGANRTQSEAAAPAGSWPPPIALFTKVYQELKLDYGQSAALTSEAGLDGIDCPVRPGGQVLPERVEEDLPRYAEALRRRDVKLLLLTTTIQSPASPHAEKILRTARKLGVTHYRLGYWSYKNALSEAARIAEVKGSLKELAALNRELGMCAIFQNHSGNQVGSKVADMYEAVKELDPDEVAIAFDPGHALIELGDGWAREFEALESHFRIAYVKDVGTKEQWVRFGDGELGRTDFFQRLRKKGYSAPISMHTEHKWAGGGEKTREKLLTSLRHDLTVLRGWLREA
jgi:sugar phosphate isomerase/epimerase